MTVGSARTLILSLTPQACGPRKPGRSDGMTSTSTVTLTSCPHPAAYHSVAVGSRYMVTPRLKSHGGLLALPQSAVRAAGAPRAGGRRPGWPPGRCEPRSRPWLPPPASATRWTPPMSAATSGRALCTKAGIEGVSARPGASGHDLRLDHVRVRRRGEGDRPAGRALQFTRTPKIMFRHELRPVIATSTNVMDKVFVQS